MKLDELWIANRQQLTAHADTQYTVVVQFISNVSGDTEASNVDELVYYFINDQLYICVRAAPAVYIGQFDTVESNWYPNTLIRIGAPN
jgi:hypothetical protein